MATAILPAPDPANGPVAPWWHTTVFVTFFAASAAAGFFTSHAQYGASPHSRPPMAAAYLVLAAAEWALVWFIAKAGLRRRGFAIRDLLGESGLSFRGISRDLALAAALWFAWKSVILLFELTGAAGPSSAVAAMLPRGVLESVAWIALALSAGFAEEFAFRGYLQRQFTALTGSAPLAAVLQSLVFGIAHGYEGLSAAAAITIYGLLFTLLALWRRSLRPGIMAHAWTDIVAGLLGW
jgi:uncharacterized protein